MATFTFTNSTSTTIPPAGSFARSVTAFGMVGTVIDVSFNIAGLSHKGLDLLGFLLIAPDYSHNLVFMWGAGGTSADAGNYNFTFSDAAAAHLADFGPVTSGTYKPTVRESTPTEVDFGAGLSTYVTAGPVGSNTFSTAFDGINPLGVWTFRVGIDGSFGETGSFSAFGVTLTTASEVADFPGQVTGDTLIISPSGGSVTFNGAAASFSGVTQLTFNGGGGDDTFVGGNEIDVVNGDDANDSLSGGGGNDVLTGGEGNDSLTGGAGGETLDGGNGGDTLVGGTGADRMLGGLGNDVFRLIGSEGVGDIFSGGAGTDQVQVTGTASATLSQFKAAAVSIEQWAGNARGLIGTAAANVFDFSTLTLMSGLPSIDGKEGNDNIKGSKFVDTLLGDAGNDTLSGLAGNDTLLGGIGKDALTGGTGSDTFKFVSKTHSVVGANADRILDFDDGGLGDKIDVSALFPTLMTYRHNLAFTSAGQVRMNDVAGADVIVEVNISGSLAPDFSIRLVGTTLASMNAGDFIL